MRGVVSMGEALQSLELSDYEPQLWSCLSCFCGLCVEGCPCYRATLKEVFTARGLSQVALAVLEGQLDIKEVPDWLLYACSGCRWCEWDCSMNTPKFIVEHGDRRTRVSGATIAELLRALRVEVGLVPRQIRDVLNSLVRYGNPYGLPRAKKAKWVEELGAGLREGQDTLLFVGSSVPFEDRAREMAEALTALLRSAGLDFGISGDEVDSGATARALGEEGLFAELVEHNKKLFEKHGIKRIICLSPHDYDAFTHYYGLKGVEVIHYTQVLYELISSGRLRPKRALRMRAVYHDPCYLGRRHGIYNEPRAILSAIPGLELHEPRWTRERSFCCGGGGPGLFYDVPGLELHFLRAEQLAEVGADVVAVACPLCKQMLDSAVKSKDYEIEVRGIEELLSAAL